MFSKGLRGYPDRLLGGALPLEFPFVRTNWDELWNERPGKEKGKEKGSGVVFCHVRFLDKKLRFLTDLKKAGASITFQG